MADKEERITIHQVLYPCKKCSINCKKSDWKDCDFYQNYISGMTRQEAIEKMANAFYDENVVRCNSDDCPPGSETCDGCPIWENCEHLAKIALNALLEDNK